MKLKEKTKDIWPLSADLSRFPHRMFKMVRWGAGSSAELTPTVKDKSEEVSDMADADVIASQIKGSKLHTFMLDLDVPARLVKSSTEGHSHLYIDVPVCWEAYVKVLDALANAGVLQEAYVEHSKRKGYTALRLPWVKKEEWSPAHPDFGVSIDVKEFEITMRESIERMRELERVRAAMPPPPPPSFEFKPVWDELSTWVDVKIEPEPRRKPSAKARKS